ncbi:DsbE family thiol:disulfide interchange protein [Kordiimonas laminariae]|uniref:DsbE family thiol:disulfide interchange protein n=1 Tax=Kordiimonas laminariae TaxID=2917717 RepID=UPI001FF18969|nr:DsbE family thiol:disulfide interchange protein [Kordiimonas laminariae]MCK0069994.1 DsbE family thiol:disulfide interchange protein [Kordiimonas laminariae]
MNGFGRFIPLLIVVVLVGVFLSVMMSDRNPKEIKSVMIGKPVPTFEIPNLFDGQSALTDARLRSGKPVIVNFFASWCLPCRAEHENLVTLASGYTVDVIGIAYKDDPEASRDFLDELGNPYAAAGVDRDGRLAIDWGVSGVPETFLIDGEGVIRYRHWGPIVGDSLRVQLLPQLEELQ